MNTSRRLELVWMLVACCLCTPNSAGASDASELFPTASAESTGLSTAALEQLADVVRGYLEDGQIVGAELLVIKNRHIVLHEAFGLRDRENDVAMTPNTIFNIRSMTKPLTGAAIQMLIDEGRLGLDDLVSDTIAGFDNETSGAITVEQLLTHRSGLPVTVMTSVNQFENLHAMANAVGKHGPEFPPGSKFWYSDPGTDVLGAIVERVAGTGLDEFWQQRLLDPLGMSDTFVPLDNEDPRWSRLANAYTGRTGEWNLFWSPDKDPLYPFAWGSQTLYATPMDYARFLAMWMDGGKVGNEQLLSAEAISRTLTPASEAKGMGTDARMPTGFSNLSTHYGQMAVVYMDTEAKDSKNPTVVGHSGSDGTFAWAWPQEDLMVLYFTQSRGGISGLSLERWIDELLIHPGDQSASASDLTALYEEIVGNYLANYGSVRNTTLKVLLSNSRPAIDLGKGRVIELRDPDEEGNWYFSISDKTSVSFTRNKDGNIDAMRMHEGPWDFEAPREGVPIAAELDEETLLPYLGTYTAEEKDGDIVVVISNHRLALDKSGLSVNLPTDVFELLPPGEDGRWGYRVNKRLAVSFTEANDGRVVELQVFQDGNPAIKAIRTTEDTAPLPSVGDIMELRNSIENAEIIEGLGGVLMQGMITLGQLGTEGPLTTYTLGTDRYRIEIELDQGSIVETLNATSASSTYFSQEFVHEGKYLEQARNNHPLLSFLDWRDIYETVEVTGRRTERGRNVYVVRTTDGDTSPIVHYVDAENGDVLRTQTIYLAVTSDVSVETTYEDFRVVAGLRIPHRTTASTKMTGDAVQEIKEIKTQQELPEDLFAQ